MRIPPPDVVAAWPPPNYVNPQTHGPALLAVELTIMPLTLIVLLARLYCRIVKVRNCGWDDWLMAAATVFGLGVTICVILADQLYGWNIHAWDLTRTQTIRGRQVSIAAQSLFLIASGLAKVSILMLYLRIATRDSPFRRLTHVSIWLVTSLSLIFFIMLWTQCSPIQEYWDLDPGRSCINEGTPLMAQTITSVLTDFLVYILPLRTVIGLRLAAAQKIALLLVFSLGLLVVLAGCMRTYYIHHVVEETYDATWSGFYLWIWTAVKVNLGVICGSIPTLRPLFGGWGGSKKSTGPAASLPRITELRNEGAQYGRSATSASEKGMDGVSQPDEMRRWPTSNGYREIGAQGSVIEMRTWLAK